MWEVKPPADDDGYFEKMSHAIFTAGLNWKMIQKKWPDFKKAFNDFSVEKVAKFSDKDIEALMKNAKIVRNEKKIRSTIYNAQEFLRIKKEFGSFPKYLGSFKGAEMGLSNDIHERFRFMGPSTARMYLWMIGMKLKPTEEEQKWIDQHEKKMKEKTKEK
jgi:3-methyladenine DNA glycosylase Tag